MKQRFTLLAWLLLLGGLFTSAQAQTRPFPSVLFLPATVGKAVSASGSARHMAAAVSTIRYVKAGSSGTGASWSNASGDLQAMINASASGDQVWMAGGIYKPSTSGLTDARAATFNVKGGVTILGGFTGAAGTEGNAGTRTASPSSTTLSGDLGNPGDQADNAYHVVLAFINAGEVALLDGLCVSAGYANGSNGIDKRGAGICISGNVSLANCLVTGNTCIDLGGGIYVQSATGGSWENCQITNNVATPGNGSGGGGMLLQCANYQLRNCQFTANQTSFLGGGLYLSQSTPIQLVSCVFDQNAATAFGGFGGGLHITSNSNATIVNSFITRNRGNYGGGLITNSGSVATCINTTIRANTSGIAGGAVYSLNDGRINLTNSVLWDNGGANAAAGFNNYFSYTLTPPVPYNYHDQGGNIIATFDPFASSTGPALKACAPAIDAGSDAANATTTDVLDNARKVRTIDMGAAEFQGTPYTLSVTAQATLSAVCVGSSTSLQATAGGSPNTPYSYTWVAPEGATLSSTSSNPASATLTSTGTRSFMVNVTDALGCLATASISVTATALPTQYSVTGGGSYCSGSNGVGIGLSGSQSGVNYQLRRDGNPVGSPLAGTGSALSFGNQTAAGTYTVLATNATTTCQQPMSGSASVTITPLPDAPSLVTANGYPYPAGQSNLTISQNVGPVSLTVVGCSAGMIMANGNAASSFTITTAMTGTQTYTATCTQNGCTSPAGSFQLTVVPTTLSVLHRDADYGQLTNNIIKPFLELANAGGQAIPYGEVTVRYWFTSEGNAPPTNLAVYYAQLGTVNMNYVALSQPRQGAYGYVEYSFPGRGNLAGGGNSGPIENGIQKTDGSNFDESDDYSYQANYQTYTPNARITAYRNGAIVWGQEPTSVASQTAVQVYSQARDQVSTSQIQTRLELRNTGNVALPVGNLKLRYYFTSDNGQLANVYVDYADIGASNVSAQVVKLGTPVGRADSYVELTFPGNPMQLNALSSLGAIDFRLVRSDYGLFDQSNDYSFMANYGNGGLNNRVTAYLNNTRIFGTPPSGAPARVITQEPSSVLQARVLGNPVVGSQAEVEIRGVVGQAVSLKLVDLQGRALHEQRIEQAGEVETVSLELGQSRGTLLLKVSTAQEQQSLKLLRP